MAAFPAGIVAAAAVMADYYKTAACTAQRRTAEVVWIPVAWEISVVDLVRCRTAADAEGLVYL